MQNSNSSSTGSKKSWILVCGAGFVLIAAVLSICLGAVSISLPQLWKSLLSGPDNTAAARILWYSRLPRTAASLLAGAGLAVSGAVIQKVLANNLASPGIIGVNAGAGLAVAACCAFGTFAAWAIAGASFLGAMVATFLVVIVARKSSASRTTVVLGGVAVTACLSAVTETIITMVPDAALASVDFRVGGFSAVNHSRLLPAAILIIAGIVVVLTLTNELDVLSLGDDTARALGLRVSHMRNGMLTLAALLAGASVSFAGILGFVGLIVPHMARRIIGSESGKLIPFCALLGAGFVTVCDLAARLIFAPYELPTGILMSFLGGPFFIWLLLKRKDKRP
ncbi:MAG: iron ABC transporter permease [Oscillospiraceae bacterium]|nr:iron ABC transporter permease [Oscillospiraceae bacterium]